MKKSSLFKILYGYILSQIAVMCITAGLMGVTIADSRTKYMINGEEAVMVQIEESVDDLNKKITKRLLEDKMKRVFCSLPAPVGNISSLIVCIENLFEN